MKKLFQQQSIEGPRAPLGDSYYKSSDQILVVNRSVNISQWSTRSYLYIFDFEFRTMTAVTDYNSSREATETHPFPSLDPEMLRTMHDKLVNLGGNPKPLADEPDAKRAFAAPAGLRKPPGQKP
jgi:hypothetical protein